MWLWMVPGLLILFMGWVQPVQCAINRLASQFSSPGDYVIGGLFAVHSSVQKLQDGTHIVPICTSFHAPSYRRLLAMRFAIEEINKSSRLLPNITLGYDIHDTCSDTLVALRPALDFAATQHSGRHAVEVRCNYTDYQPRVLAVIGPGISEICIILARLFGFFGLPQVSYSASSEILSDRARFPSFFRTIPSDKGQVRAIAQLVSYFRWNWVAALGTDDEYGRKGIESLTELVSVTETCLAYQDLIPVHASEEEAAHRLSSIVDGLVQSRVNVTILFASETHLAPLMGALIARNVTEKVWIASADWSTAASIAGISNISSLGTVVGFAFKSNHMEGFAEYVEQVLSDQGSGPSGVSRSSDAKQCPECGSLTLANVSTILDRSLYRRTFTTYTAVYTVAHALHKLLRCSVESLQCDKGAPVYPWQLLEELVRVNFTVGSEAVYFSKDGDLPAGYDLITWDWSGKSTTPDFRVVGQYDTLQRLLQVNASGIYWFTGSKEAPPSNCSQECEPGQMKRVKEHNSCCYECESCLAGFFQNISDDPLKCTRCPSHQWSNEKSTDCQDRTLEYPNWADAISILMGILVILGLLLTVAVTIVFAHNYHTPAVQDAGGLSSLLILFSLACVCSSFCLFIGKPSLLRCQIRQPLFSSSFTVCLSVLLGKSLQVSGLCHPVIPICGLLSVYICVLLNVSIQTGLCFSWYSWNPPFVVQNPNISASSLVVECREDALTGFGLLLGHNGLLALTCFMLTFMGRSSGKSYPSARNITFSALIYLLAWIFFIPTYVTSTGKNLPFFQLGSGLISVFGMLGAYFIPRCYIMVCKPELNALFYFRNLTQETMSNPEVVKSEGHG